MTLANLQVARNLHQLPMKQNNAADVNPVPVDYMDSQVIGAGLYAGCTDFVWKASKEEGGSLFSPAPDIPVPAWARYFGFNRRVMFLTPDQLGRDEFDVKFTFANGMQLNGSNQINWSEGGMWQVDPNVPPKWEDTQFDVKYLLVFPWNSAEGWNDFQVRWSTDGTIWNIDSLACNGTVFTSLPANCKSIPLNKTTWSANMAHTQIQAEVMNCPAYCVVRYHNAQVVMSDQPIPSGWF